MGNFARGAEIRLKAPLQVKRIRRAGDGRNLRWPMPYARVLGCRVRSDDSDSGSLSSLGNQSNLENRMN
jgi:hypothetical protein